MTQPDALPADPFPDLALVYDTPVVMAYRIESGRYLTVDLEGVEISWLLDNDEQAVGVAYNIGHRIVCNDADCRVCGAEIATDRVEAFTRPAQLDAPLASVIPRQPDGTTPARRVWLTATVLGASTAWLWRVGRGRRG
jgi:hypothetical protein